jgi:GTP-binding protein HflX
VVNIEQVIHGELAGVKKAHLDRLESLYSLSAPGGYLLSGEILDEMVALTAALNREVAVYLDRKGQVIGVYLGDASTVSLQDQGRRRSPDRLSKVRLLHTHPGGSGRLSSVDIAALYRLGFDCVVGIGVRDGGLVDVWAGFIQPGNNWGKCLFFGPLKKKEALSFPFLETVKGIERELGQNQPAEITPVREKALVVGVDFKRLPGGELGARDSLEELARLVEAAGAQVLKEVFQSRDKPDGAYYAGRGLVRDLALLVQVLQVDLVIFDGELTGTQMKRLEETLGCKVMDRTGIILDIFAQRARSREGKLQVELAQMEYLLPRLTGFGQEMSRLAGGIGTRGPGETKLEKDRRYIQRRIVDLKKELSLVSQQRQVLKASRRRLPLVALVGYTNAGKSTLRYKLLEKASVNPVTREKEDPGTNRLFATLDTTIRSIALPGGREVLLADTVGFIQRLPHQLISAFKATLEEVVEADLLLHVVDASHPQYEEQMLAVEKTLRELGADEKKIIVVYNKIDLLEGDWPDQVLDRFPACRVSGVTGQGMEDLLETIGSCLESEGKEVRLLLPHEEASLLGLIYKEARVRHIDYRPDGIYLKAIIRESLFSRLNSYLV